MSYYMLYMFNQKKEAQEVQKVPDLYPDSKFDFKNVSFEVKKGIVILSCKSEYHTPIGWGDYKYFPIDREYVFPFFEGDAIELEVYESHIQEQSFTTVNAILIKNCPYYKKIGITKIVKKNPNSIYHNRYICKCMDFFINTDGKKEQSSQSTGEKYQYDYEKRDADVFYTTSITQATWVVEETEIKDPPHIRGKKKILYTERNDVYNIVQEIISHY